MSDKGRWHPRWFIYLSLAISMLGCHGLEISIADVFGTYRAVIPNGEAILEVKQDGKWEYRLDGKSTFRRSGTWALEPSQTTPSGIHIGFENFDLGFSLGALHIGQLHIDLQGPKHWFFMFERVYPGKIRTCIEDLDPTYWGPQGRICFERQ